jgi:hypothetical protein
MTTTAALLSEPRIVPAALRTDAVLPDDRVDRRSPAARCPCVAQRNIGVPPPFVAGMRQ